MILARRSFLQLASAAALAAQSCRARAQSYPVRPVHVVSGFPPGGISDTYARLMSQWLTQRMGQTFVVDNRPGVGGNLAAETVAHAVSDGYTLLLTTSGDAWNATLYDNLKYDYLHDIMPVGTITRGAGVLVVNPSFPPRSVPELIAYAKRNPGKATIASAGIGSAPHMFWELFRSMTGVEMLHVPYRGGGPAVIDLIAGQVQTYFGTMASVLEHVMAGKLVALAVTSASRLTVLPDVPAMAELVPGYQASIYVGFGAPRGTPSIMIEALNRQMNLALADPQALQAIAAFGDAPLPLSTAEFGRLMVEEVDKWASVIRTAHIRAE